jgi:hypothetical protein
MIARFSPARNRTVMNAPRQSRFAIGGLPIFAMRQTLRDTRSLDKLARRAIDVTQQVSSRKRNPM